MYGVDIKPKKVYQPSLQIVVHNLIMKNMKFFMFFNYIIVFDLIYSNGKYGIVS